jgi:hypothetical protein
VKRISGEIAMQKNFTMLIGTVMIGTILIAVAPVIAESPYDAINANHSVGGQLSNVSMIDSRHPYYVWINPFAIDLTKANPDIFQNAAFGKEPGGVLSSNLLTASINNFLKADLNAGYSNVNKKVAKIGLVNRPNKGNITVPAASGDGSPETMERKFFVQGMVYIDQNGNFKMDNNETGLANVTVNLEQPSGNVISKFTTNNSGGYGFYDLKPGEYILAETSIIGWSIISPPNGKYAVNLTNNVTALNFGNEIMPEQTQNMTVPSNEVLSG